MSGEQDNLKQKVVKGAFWTALERFSCQIVAFVVGMVLARLLTPDDYGTVALMTIFFAVTSVLIDAGFAGALVQKKDSDDLDFNSVFYLSLTLSLIGYAIMFVAAPWIAQFYKTPLLTPIIRIAAISFVFNAVNSVQNAELNKKMLFDKSFKISVITSFTSAVCGIVLALLGCGVWALVCSTLLASLAGCVARWFIIAWRPRLAFSFARLKPLFSYGWKMAASAVLDQLFANLNGLLIGKFYSRVDLAYVNKGSSLPQLLTSQIDGSINRVSFPALVQMQDRKTVLRDSMRRMMRCSTFLVFPLMVGVAACSKDVLQLLYGSQWVPAAPYMMITCFSFALYPFHTINLNGIMALGRSDVFLKLEIVKKIAKVIVILAFFPFGILPFVAACAFALGPLSVIINSWPNKKLLDYTLKMQVFDVLPTAAVCVVEAAVVFGIGLIFAKLGWSYETTRSVGSLFAVLSLQFVLGAAVFFGIAWAFKLQPVHEFAQMAGPVLGKFRRSN